MDRELYLIGGEFQEKLLPKDRQWLWKYFKSDIERQFATYYGTVKSHTHFSTHTGYFCTQRWLYKLQRRYVALERAYQEARASGDIELVAAIEMGNYDVESRTGFSAK